MASSSSPGWVPRWAYDGEPYAVVVIRTGADEPTISWGPSGDAAAAAAAAEFLASRRQQLADDELTSKANFLYVVMRRASRPGEDGGRLDDDSAVAEFGYGSPPASPEGWPLIELRTLLDDLIERLGRTQPS